MTDQATELRVRKSIALECTPEHAFATFTERIGSWWPLGTYSLGEERAVSVVVERRVGGRVYEVWGDGTEHAWTKVTAWDPPSRLAVSWSVNPDAAAPTTWEVRFAAEGDRTRVELEHWG
jgi:Activator of Hsp90 ATPase homolog 1-like protein